jgi:flagella basal body P-ring formation protein FlgA
MILLYSQASYESSVGRYLMSKLPDVKKIEVSLLGDWNKYETVQIIEEKDPDVRGKIVYIPVTLKNGNDFGNSTLAVEITLFDEVLVAGKDIKRGEELTPDVFKLTLADITIAKSPVRLYSEITNMLAQQYIKKGEVLSTLFMEEKPVVHAGDKLTAHSIAGNVDVSFTAIAKQHGKAGEVIRIRSTENNLFTAKILDNSNVLIIE